MTTETTVFQTRAAAARDDVEEHATGKLSNNTKDLEMADDGSSNQTVGLRFAGIDVPLGAIITAAYLQFRSDEVSSGPASLLIQGEDADDATAFAGDRYNVSSRFTTDASAAWAPADWTARGEADLAQRTPDLAAIVQEIVDRSGWAALNDMVFPVTGSGTRTATFYEGSATGAPLLDIEYSLPGPLSDPVAFDDPPDSDPAANEIAELAAAGMPTGVTASATDPDASDTVTYSIDDLRFAIDADTGVVTRSADGLVDFETENSITFTVTATSSDRSTATRTFDIGVLDDPELVSSNTPPNADPDVNSISETADEGTVVGITASASDPDAGSSVSYSIDDPRFAIDADGAIPQSSFGTLDAVSQPSIDLTATATSSDGSSATQDFTTSVGAEQTQQPEALFRFAVFGDYGDGGAGEAAVATLVDGWNVDFILTTGDNAYGSIAFDDAVGQFFSDYIGNYVGSYGSGSDINRFFPTLGDGDYDDDSAGLNGGIDIYLDYFTLPDNERYYDFQVGSVHFFALNSDSNEPDGHEPGSTQALWFDATAAASNALFEIAYFHHTPYKSDGSGDADLRWAFEPGGVDAVFAGHSHSFDLVTRDDDSDGVQLPYVTTGMGGHGQTSPSKVGANLVTVTDAGMQIEFYLADGTLVDSYFVEAAAGGNPQFVNGHDVMNGSAGSDYLWGLGGNDTLTGFAGNDMLIGGQGADRFVFGVGSDADVIADFTPGEDVLDLRAFGIDSAAAFQQIAVNQGSDVFLDFGGGDMLLLRNVQEEEFQDNDLVAGAVENIPPTITSADTATVAEGQTLALDVDAIDDGIGLVYSISGGADQARFGIDSSTGVLYFLSAPDFEAPADADGNNAYQVQVTVTDSGGLTDVQDITVNVADIDENAFVFETRVAVAGDDVEERGTGKLSNNISDLEMADDGSSNQTVGIRFTGIDIPQGAIITAAYIQFQADEVSSGPASLLIQGEDVDDATAFTGDRYNVSSRSTTDASTAWAPADWTARGEADLAQRTPDLAAIVQEIVDRSGWAALNDMVFLVTGTGTRTAESYEGDATGAPLLHIEYSLPGPLSDPVAFDDPPDADPAANEIAELAAAGMPIGITASATDPDASDTVTYSIDDPRFAIDANTGVVTRSADGLLDFETENAITLTVTATSSDRSTATRTFSIGVLDDPEPVAFNTPPDADAAANSISETADEGTVVGITASASDPDAGDTVTYSIDDARFAIDANTGIITRSHTGTLDAGTEPSITLEVTATSSDGSTASETFSVSVKDDQFPTSLILVNTVLTSQWSPPSPDPSGIAYISHLGTLLISDGEVNEMPHLFTGDNLFQMTLSGSLVNTLTTFAFSDEPTGVAYNPVNRHLFFSDDTGTRSVYELDPGPDGQYNTSDDVVTSFATNAFGSKDPEGLTYDTTRSVLYIAGGVDDMIYIVDPGSNGRFDGVPSVGGDDIVTSFSTEPLGIHDPEGIEYDPVYDLLYVTASRDEVAMVSPTGELLGMLDISEANTRNPAGLALAPSSSDPSQMSLYLVDRGVDNNSDPNENDGKVFEFMFGDDVLLA